MEWAIEPLLFIKLGIAAGLGFLFGIEREMKKKPVGIKTSIVICVTACLLTIVSIEASYIYAEAYSRPMDPLRLAAQIVSGIGFIGAGVILRRSNEAISGLTTAAIIWAAAGIGIAVGAGFYVEAVSGVLIIIVAVEMLPPILMKLGPKSLSRKQLHIKMLLEEEVDMTHMLKQARGLGFTVKRVRIKDVEGNEHNMYLDVMADSKIFITDIYRDIKALDGVRSVEIHGD